VPPTMRTGRSQFRLGEARARRHHAVVRDAIVSPLDRVELLAPDETECPIASALDRGDDRPVRPVRFVGIVVMSAVILAACGPHGPVALRHGDGQCYDGWNGNLAFDSATGEVTFDSGSGPLPVEWPSGYTGRLSGSEVEIVNRDGKVLHRTGTRVSMLGDGYGGQVFKECGMELIR